MVLGLAYGKFPEVEDRRRQHRGGMPFADAVHQMIEITHAAGGNHRDVHAVRDLARQRKVKTLPGAVPAQRGEQDVAGAKRNDFLRVFDGVNAGGFASTMGEDLPAIRAAASPDAFGVDRNHDALIAEFFRRFLDEFAATDGSAVDRHLVRAGSQQHADIVHGAHTAAHRQRHEAGFRRAPHHIQHSAPISMWGRNVEKAQFIGAGGVIGDSRLDGVAGVAQIDEVDALDHPAILDIEAVNHADLEHRRKLPVFSLSMIFFRKPVFTFRDRALSRGARVTDQRQCRGGIKASIVKCPAGYGAGQLFGARGQQRLHIVDGSKAARGDDGDRNAVRKLDGGFEIETFQQTVARNVGEDDRGDAGILEALRNLKRGDLRGLRPAFNRDLTVTRVETDRDAAGESFRSSLDQFRITHRRGADDHARNAFCQPGFNGFQVADAAPELHRHPDRFQHRLYRQRVHRLAGEGAVEIDHMQIFETLRGETARLRRRLKIEHGRARHVALFQAHALTVFQVDGGKKNHVALPAPSPLVGEGWGGGQPRVRYLWLTPLPNASRSTSPSREEVKRGALKVTITASISKSSKSGPARNAGSSPDETGYR